MLRTLPMLEIDPSTFCAICVSSSVGAAARLRDIDAHQGKGDIRTQIDRQADERNYAEKEQHHEQDDGDDGMAYRPSRNISHDPRATGLTTSPSCRKAPAVVTT